MNATKLQSVRNVIGSTLFGFGWMNFFCIGLIDLWWTSHGPKVPDPVHGFIFLHSEKWLIAYFSSFQVTAVGLWPYVSIAVTVAGFFIAPKKWDFVVDGKIVKYPKLTNDDPFRLYRWGLPAGMVASPPVIYFVGPSFVTWLNGLGF